MRRVRIIEQLVHTEETVEHPVVANDTRGDAVGNEAPTVLLALGATAVSRRLGWFRDHYRTVSVVTGALLVVVGFLMLTNTFARLSGLLTPIV